MTDSIKKLKIAFVCVGNASRSQMAEGFARFYSRQIKNWEIEAYSAGTHIAGYVMPETIKVMKEAGIDISEQYPKTLYKIPSEHDLLFTMGCNVDCPYIPAKYRQDWGLDDPVGMTLEFYRKTRDRIHLKVKSLLKIIEGSKDINEVIHKLRKSKIF